MATALKKGSASPPPPPDRPSTGAAPVLAFLSRLLDSIYRFLASLKLAVITIASLAAVLAYATFFNAAYGTAAVDEWIYKSKGFAVLLAFLGANILCAALIRFPWKKRQTGFVITHAGLLILLGGSWYGLMAQDEGVVGAMEGEVKDELIRSDYPAIRVRQVDPHNPEEALREWEFPFRPGAFGWGPGNPRPRSIFATLNPMNLFDHEDRSRPREVVTKPGDPFQIVVKSHMPASIPATIHVPDASGAPMVKIRPFAKPPGSPQPRDVFRFEEDRWFGVDDRFYHVEKARDPGTSEPLPARFVFSYVDRPELVEDFLDPPAAAGPEGTARFRYRDRADKPRVFDWPIEGDKETTKTLPDSDLTVKFLGTRLLPTTEFNLQNKLGSAPLPIAQFEVKQGAGPAVKYMSLANLPMFPNLLPNEETGKASSGKPLVRIHYCLPPVVDPKTNGLFGVVEVLGTPEGALYYRVFGRPKAGGAGTTGEIRSKGPLALGKEVVAFGGNPNMPMSISFIVSDFLKAGIEKEICEPIALPKGQMENGIAASLVEMTAKDGDTDVTKEFYIRRSRTLDYDWQTVVFPNAMFQVAYDVNRKPLGFEIKLEDFEVTFNPGTDQARSYVSKVLLTDKAEGVDKKPMTVTMNEPIEHRGYVFYQSSYQPETFPRSNRKTGRFQSIFHVGYDPARYVKYSGCLLVIFGAFVQFYMRAGLFTDGGKREREKLAAKAIVKGATNGYAGDPLLLTDVESTARTRAADVEEAL